MNQRVLVTAGASGIGLAIARAFVQAGAKVHIADRDAAAVARAVETHPGLTASIVDIRDAAANARLMDDVRRTLGGLDVLVNNAGIPGPTTSVEDYAEDTWREVLDVNLTGTFLVTQQAIPLLKASPQATILIMSSVAGRFGYANRSAYATSKWGLVGFAKTLSLELAPVGITCNTLHPGAVDGDRIQRVLEGRAQVSGRSVEEELETTLHNQSIKRLTDPDDIAALAVFLAGKHARSISGQSFPIDGDSKAAQ
jgi:NAD(P)-dependent dehydrogenase (short-subunit alcohol dehydrogenase family)